MYTNQCCGFVNNSFESGSVDPQSSIKDPDPGGQIQNGSGSYMNIFVAIEKKILSNTA